MVSLGLARFHGVKTQAPSFAHSVQTWLEFETYNVFYIINATAEFENESLTYIVHNGPDLFNSYANPPYHTTYFYFPAQESNHRSSA